MTSDQILEVDHLVSVIEQSTKMLYAILAGLERMKNNEHFNKNVRKTHCIRGHKRTPENIYASGNCKVCSALRYKLKRDKQREAP